MKTALSIFFATYNINPEWAGIPETKVSGSLPETYAWGSGLVGTQSREHACQVMERETCRPSHMSSLARSCSQDKIHLGWVHNYSL